VKEADDRPLRAGRWPLTTVPRVSWGKQVPTARDADPRVIAVGVERALARPSGNWFVVGASDNVRGARPYGTRVLGREIVLWRDSHGTLAAGPGACPHLGAPLAEARVVDGCLVCRWHGLRLPSAGWRPFPACDDGVLAWVRLDEAGGETPLDAPVAAARRRPPDALSAVARLVGVCEPRDVLANRLDPWHGAWFHPHSFTRLRVEAVPTPEDDRYLVHVTFRVGPWFGVPVLAEFTCPDPRTVLMRILDGEGAGSVVETHATPLGNGRDGRPRTAVIEAVVATSGRPGFAVARAAAPLLRPLVRRAATRLWRDDLAYAERRYALRSGAL
jgi:Domain of unknown function (DUF5914)/Rieske [2Fe-2S] domain